MKFFFLLLLPVLVWGGPLSIYQIGDLSVAFVQIDGLKVSRGCQEKRCLALKQGAKFREKVITGKVLTGGKNPSAVKCKEVLGGEVVIGHDRRGNQQSFCQFDDDSYLLNSF